MARFCKTGVLLWVLLWGASGRSADKIKVDGSYWEQLTEKEKVAYIVGYVDGRDDGYKQGKYQALLAVIDVPGVRGAPSEKAAALSDSSSGIPYTFGQLVDGIDACYKDFRNRLLQVSTCYKWAVDGIQGKDDKTREIYLETIRRLYAGKQ
jgi:hypothetical protein